MRVLRNRDLLQLIAALDDFHLRELMELGVSCLLAVSEFHC